MQTHRPLILKNYMLKTMVEMLDTPLQARMARSRNKFIVLFTDIMKDLEEQRLALIPQYAELDAEGKPKKFPIGHENGGNYMLRDQAGWDKAFGELVSRTVAVPCIGDQYIDFTNVMSILDNLETHLTVKETTIYNEIMEAFEDWAGNNDEDATLEEV